MTRRDFPPRRTAEGRRERPRSWSRRHARQDENSGRQLQRAAGRGDRRLSRRAADPLPRAPLRRPRNLRRNPRERARPRRFHRPVDVLSDQRQSDGAADHDRRAAARLGAAHHGGHPLFRLRAPGPQTGPALADLGQAGRQSHHPRRRRPRAHRRSARRADPGLFRHPDRQSVRRADDGARHQGARRDRERDGGVARRRRRGARARASPSGSTRRSPSSTSGASAPANPR